MHKSRFFKITSVILGLLTLGLFGLVFLVYRDIKTKNEHISILEHDFSIQASKQEYLISTQKILQDLAPDIANINNSIIASGGEVQFIESLESIAKGNGLLVVIDSIVSDDNPKSVSNSVSNLKIKAKMKGSWIGTYRFLAQIESLPTKIKINKFSFINTEIQIDSGAKVGTSGNGWQSLFEITALQYK